MAIGKAPKIDGIAIEFFQFWFIIGVDCHKMVFESIVYIRFQ